MVLWRLMLMTLLGLATTHAQGAERRYTLSAQGLSLAPNAGGQTAYGLKLATNDWEAGLFSNQYLTAGGHPLSGGTIDWRLPICDDSCWWQFFVQVGGGACTGGPIAEMTWGMIIPPLPLWLPTSWPRFLPALRLDITTHIIFLRYRGITWSYPLWAGIAVAI